MKYLMQENVLSDISKHNNETGLVEKVTDGCWKKGLRLNLQCELFLKDS